MTPEKEIQAEKIEVVEIRCNFCHRLAFKASIDTRGMVETKCKRCGRLMRVRLPRIKKEIAFRPEVGLD